ncbi:MULTISPECIES: MarR family transcriptional regulator [unclassified Novosphingobium]|uniref:MarR family winged helix-turn-helix transcriptional regulator n=1 Tax=unclassified Novosphingobium TaxID=2644732 RepID=UPI001469E4F2|nr:MULTISPECIES: MarR family transcriptional regulator [unclassified Novosphingobium]NMN06101.1 DNA-binding MarR family transcriptional regulator [Novosphingobium sp. SG919]NMN88398.1 DNA-binding MarR family transcriptional regulator [Novosphingobium sp. SG916]
MLPPLSPSGLLANSLDRLLGYQLRRASAVMMADLARELADIELRPAEVTALLVVAENPGCSQTEVGQVLGIKRANMVPIVSRLMDRGLIDRERADGRSHALRVTDTGAAVVADAKARIERHEQRFSHLFDADTLAALHAALPVIRAQREDAEG